MLAKRLAVNIIQNEHHVYSEILRLLRDLVWWRSGETISDDDFKLYASILYYIDEFPERLHHPKEDRYLFRFIRVRTSECDAVLSELEAEHKVSKEQVLQLHRLLNAYQCGILNAGYAFNEAVKQHVQFQFEHMRKEEMLILPLAERVLEDEDWVIIASEFHANDHPEFGLDSRLEFRALRERIALLAPKKFQFRTVAREDVL